MNKKSYLARVRLPRTPAEWLEAMMNFIFFLCGMLAVGCVVLISVYMVISGVPAIHKIGLFRFLLGTEWASTAAEPKFGILPFILTSIYGTAGAILIGVPIGFLTAVFLSKVAPPKVAAVIRPAVDLLAGIPSVVYGFIGMIVLVPAVMIGLALAVITIKPLNLLLFGEEYAVTMGLNIRSSRGLLFLSTTLLAGTVTAFCGPIGFIGLAMPHVTRMLFDNSDHRILIPGTVLTGASVLLLCDLVSKLFTLPVNAITALLGIPVVVWVVLRNKSVTA